MKNKLSIIAPWVIIGILITFLLLPDKQHNTNADQHAEVIATHDTVNEHGVDYRRVIDSLSIDNYRLDSVSKSLYFQQAFTQWQLHVQTGKVNSLAAQVKESNKDKTLSPKIDSLVNEINNLTFLLAQYESYADSINKINDSLKINYDAAMKEKDKRIAELQVAYDNLFKAYQQLFADSQGLVKDLKRQKLKTKIAAVLGGAAAVLGLIK